MCSTSHALPNVFKFVISSPFRFNLLNFNPFASSKPGLQEEPEPATSLCSPTELESLPALELGEEPQVDPKNDVAPTELDSSVSRDEIEPNESSHEMMMEEARNQDVPSPGDSAPCSPEPDVLRRRDQLMASRGDSPAAKGRGRGRGGKGKGRGRGRSAKKSVETEGDEPAPKIPKSRAKRSKEPKSQSVAEDPQHDPPTKKTRERKGRAASASASSKRKAPDTKQAEPEVEGKEDAVPAPRKKRAPKTKKGEEETDLVTPPRKQQQPEQSKPTPPKAAKAKPQVVLSEDDKESMKKGIQTFDHSTVVPYWSRAAAGLKVTMEAGTSQAGPSDCIFCFQVFQKFHWDMLAPGWTCQQAFYLSGPSPTACSMRTVLEKIQEIVPGLDICCGQIIAGQYPILVFCCGWFCVGFWPPSLTVHSEAKLIDLHGGDFTKESVVLRWRDIKTDVQQLKQHKRAMD